MNRFQYLTFTNYVTACFLVTYANLDPDLTQAEVLGWCIFAMMYMSMDTPARDDGMYRFRCVASTTAMLLGAGLLAQVK